MRRHDTFLSGTPCTAAPAPAAYANVPCRPIRAVKPRKIAPEPNFREHAALDHHEGTARDHPARAYGELRRPLRELKRHRAVATHYGRLAVRYEATVQIAAINGWSQPPARARPRRA
ncbi:hypothetical protein DP939_33835 [Spongiactinospora rosea]|uniref:Transposase n=1 Tax=Spongiactinospora rosea TaxID=2248750 RepID=A0A366LQ63_9ACTN|nr:hypothetical protein DP939_33835 [Spongiactinospora rosea]